MTTAMARDVVLVVGDVMTDIIVRAEGPLRRGSDRAAEIRSRPGGSGVSPCASDRFFTRAIVCIVCTRGTCHRSAANQPTCPLSQ